MGGGKRGQGLLWRRAIGAGQLRPRRPDLPLLQCARPRSNTHNAAVQRTTLDTMHRSASATARLAAAAVDPTGPRLKAMGAGCAATAAAARAEEGYATAGSAAGPFGGQYATTTRSALHSAALPVAAAGAAGATVRAATLRPTASELDGRPGQIGRKPAGPHADECDKTYRRTGLRDR